MWKAGQGYKSGRIVYCFRGEVQYEEQANETDPVELATALGSEIQCEKKDKDTNSGELLTTLKGKVQYEKHANETYPVDLVIALGGKIPNEEHDKDSEN